VLQGLSSSSLLAPSRSSGGKEEVEEREEGEGWVPFLSFLLPVATIRSGDSEE